jgi:dethiobiotin synthetase
VLHPELDEWVSTVVIPKLDMNAFVVTGIGTGVGKTVVSAILTTGLEADYWKPVQTGVAEGDSDRAWVTQVLGLPEHRVHPEAYAFALPESPHYAAQREQKLLDTASIVIPKTERPLIIEGAGGLMVPLNERELYIDLFERWRLPVVLVVRLYLGAINHTLLSLEALEQRGIPVKGIIFNGPAYPSVEEVLPHFSPVPILGRIPDLASLDADTLRQAFYTHLKW